MTGYSNRVEIVLIFLLVCAMSVCLYGIYLIQNSRRSLLEEKPSEGIVFDAETDAFWDEISDAIEQLENPVICGKRED